MTTLRLRTTLQLRPQSIAMAMARWISILVVVVATTGVGAHVGEITEHRAGHDVGDQWRVGGGLATGQQRQLWSCHGGWWLVVDNRLLTMLCVVVSSACRWIVVAVCFWCLKFSNRQNTQIPLRMES